MNLLPLIYKKRVGGELTKEEINQWIGSLNSRKSPPDYQIASLLAFIWQRGMTKEETSFLTTAMRFSGLQFPRKGFSKNAIFVDKHSTGGVGDKISLPLAPLLIACDERLIVPMISGRGLGHTGGTVDKLESIPGFKTAIDTEKMVRQLKKLRVALVSQTPKITPADRVLYQLRDVTGTVESIPLITASILSKKLSESLDYLLIDLKCGSGAFLNQRAESVALAESMISVLKEAGLKADICLTDMDSPLGEASGHRLEVLESLEILKGKGPARSQELTERFAVIMLSRFGISSTDAELKVKKAISSGAALKVFEQIVKAQGGSLLKFDKAVKNSRLKKTEWKADAFGYIKADTRKIGLALAALGGGRMTKTDKIDPDVGFKHHWISSDKVERGQALLEIFYKDHQKLKAAEEILKTTFTITDTPSLQPKLIQQVWTV